MKIIPKQICKQYFIEISSERKKSRGQFLMSKRDMKNGCNLQNKHSEESYNMLVYTFSEYVIYAHYSKFKNHKGIQWKLPPFSVPTSNVIRFCVVFQRYFTLKKCVCIKRKKYIYTFFIQIMDILDILTHSLFSPLISQRPFHNYL